MSKAKGLIPLLIALQGSLSAFAAPVGSNEVARAIGAWRVRGGSLGLKMGRTVRDVRRVEKDGAAFHVVRFEGGGMAISPTDTTIRPVIMFSEEDDFDENPDNPAWDLLVPELAARARQIASRKMKAMASAAVRRSDCEAEWAELLSDLQYDKVGDDAMDDIRVPSLVKTRWNQGSAGGGYCYNYYTPEHHVCGCVATAMAQAMRYLEYPASTTEVPQFTNRRCSFLGTRMEYTTQGGFYDWSKMPYVPSSGMSEEDRQAIGKLTSDLGIMLGANYGSSGTGATSPAVQYVFTKCLGYANAISIQYDVGAWWGIDDEYAQMMMSNFDAKLPVVISLNGHEILGDGYGYRNGSLYYHLNFGWSGAAWYKPAKMEEGMEGYHVFYGAIFNIYTTRTGNPEIASGRVIDAAGRPVKGLTVKAARASSPDEVVATAVTDDNGIYAAFVPPDDCYRISAEILYENGEGHYFGTFDAKVGKSVSREVFVDTGLRTIGGVSTEFPLSYALYHGTPNCSIGNVAQCDIRLKGENFDPAATVSVSGPMTVGTDFAAARVPVSAQVSCYGNVYSEAQVTVTLTPSDGGAVLARTFTIDGDKDRHDFEADFEGMQPGVQYTVNARVTMGNAPTVSEEVDCVTAARPIRWIAESAATFPNAGWTVGGAQKRDGWISLDTSIADAGSSMAFAPASGEGNVELSLRVRAGGGFSPDRLASQVPGCAGLTLAACENAPSKFAVWGDGRWIVTDVEALGGADEERMDEYEVKVTVNRSLGKVGYRVRLQGGYWRDLGTYGIAVGGEPVRNVCFKGTVDLATLDGVRFDPNLVAAADGKEYANFTSALAAGATGVLSPLWWSTWNLTGASGSVDVRDPDGYITYTGDSKVLKTETLPDGSERKWFAQASDADVAAGAGKYVKTTVDLGLVKAITDMSVVRIGDCLVSNGTMSFTVAIDDVQVAKETVKKLVQVKATMADSWGEPDDADIRFEDGKIVVTPNRGGASGFARVRITKDSER